MSIKESALSVISSIAQSDFVRAVTSDGNSRRVTVANLAKAIVESYTGSSLGGSQRSVKAAIDSLNSNYTKIRTTANTPLTLTFPSNYRGVLFTIDSTPTRTGLYFVYSNASAITYKTAVREATGLTITHSGANIIFTSEGATYLEFLNVNGTPTV